MASLICVALAVALHGCGMTGSRAVGGLGSPDGAPSFRALRESLKDMASDDLVVANGGRTGLAAGDSFSLVLTPDGRIWMWGSDDTGLVEGHGSCDIVRPPHPIKGSWNAASLGVGGPCILVVLKNGTVAECGSYYILDGVLAVRTPSSAQVTGLESVVEASASKGLGFSKLAVCSDGSVWEWRFNPDGLFGSATAESSQQPQQVKGLPFTVSVSAGLNHYLALSSEGTVWAWGKNACGQLGDGSLAMRTTPVQLECLADIIQVEASSERSVALRKDGTVWAWGIVDADDGAAHTVPIEMVGLPPIRAVRAGGDHYLAIATDGSLWAWGSNLDGQLGFGARVYRRKPVRIPWFSGVRAVAAGTRHSVALLSDGTLWEWGLLGSIPRLDLVYPYLWPHRVPLQ